LKNTRRKKKKKNKRKSRRAAECGLFFCGKAPRKAEK